MKNENFFDRLLLLPLFQGIGRGEFMQVAERVRLSFHKWPEGKVLARQDELCTGLIFVLNGEISAEKMSDLRDYGICEWFNLPVVLQPESLFGLSTQYTRTFTAETPVQVLRIEKDAVRDILFYYPTFRINYLNLMSSRVQLAHRHIWKTCLPELPERFVQFLSARCLRPAGRKELRIDMVTLAKELLATRLNVSNMLNKFQEQGLLELHRRKIIIPNFEKLLM